jgi:hypothetical protein
MNVAKTCIKDLAEWIALSLWLAVLLFVVTPLYFTSFIFKLISLGLDAVAKLLVDLLDRYDSEHPRED